ncbi:FAD-dependent oxidoreductase [Klebsiella oxytoca]|uniref:FAD-dependent oxidoreductase n=1 Tax=Klebsiella oxytoca TaxID=571 RepID=UPI0007CCF6AC|nr:FAD-dependent oxidoreductase [Klebsiella oxytoca]SBL52451.1 ribulose-1%2C5-biphosphate synthetase [Klebsiella oxytoca]SBL62379.1 ribulose-1%2C5-biphosphate synthetase [Klebsiella oxytoca]
MQTWHEVANKIPVTYDVDVLVVGGGPTGVAAATAAARAGENTLLIERYGFCGGMATAGMSGAICGLFTSGKGPHKQLVHGFAGEFYQHLKHRGAVSEPFPFGETRLVVHEPHTRKEVADDLLSDSGARVLFHTLATDVVMDGNQLLGVIIENKSGRQLITARRFIDASGDGDLCVKAGVPYTCGRNGMVQYPTMVFRMSNVDIERGIGHPVAQLEAWVEAAQAQGYHLPRKHIYLLPSPRPDEVMCNVTSILRDDSRPIDATCAEDLTFAELKGRKQVREYERFLRAWVPGFEQARLNDVAAQIGIRQSRTIAGRYRLTNDDVFQARKSERKVASSAWCIEAHGQDGIFMFYLDNDWYDIPYDTLVPENVPNLITAGRTLSAEHEALASARVTAQCFLTGFAAGTAAWLSHREGCAFADIDVAELRSIIEYQTY